MKTFDEVFNEIKGNVTVSKSGKVKKTFSRADFDKLLKALLNDTEYEATYYTTKNGEPVPNTNKIIKKFRESIMKVLLDGGMDKAEATKFMDEYVFTKVDGFYEVITESIYKFMEANKKFDFPTREDFKGSISLKDVEEAVGTYTTIRRKDDKTPPAEFKIKTKKHKILEKKSKAPAWLKDKFK